MVTLVRLQLHQKSRQCFLHRSGRLWQELSESALGYQACRLGYRVCYYLPKLLEKLHVAKADASYSRELAKLEKQHLLILDDWGVQPLDQQAKLALLQIMEDRHGKGVAIITSQQPVAQWYDYINEPALADAILDRLLHQAHRFELKGDSVRRKTLNLN